MNNSEIYDFFWYDNLEKVLPYRYKDGVSGAFVLFLHSYMMQTLEQLLLDAFAMRLLKHPNSDDSVLNEVGSEQGIIKAATESNSALRERINNRFSILPYYGQESALVTTIDNVGLGACSISFNLTGTVFNITPPKAGPIIPAYPNSSEWPSQFIIVINLSGVLGSGTESDLITDAQLNTIRSYIRLMKPSNWVCREIVIIYNPNNDPIYNGGLTYNDGSTTYLAVGSGTGISERHKWY